MTKIRSHENYSGEEIKNHEQPSSADPSSPIKIEDLIDSIRDKIQRTLEKKSETANEKEIDHFL